MYLTWTLFGLGLKNCWSWIWSDLELERYLDQTTKKLNLQNLIENYKNHIQTSFLILRNVSRIKKTRMVVIWMTSKNQILQPSKVIFLSFFKKRLKVLLCNLASKEFFPGQITWKYFEPFFEKIWKNDFAKISFVVQMHKKTGRGFICVILSIVSIWKFLNFFHFSTIHEFVHLTARCIKTTPLATKLYRELQGRVFVGFWIGTLRWKALTSNFKMARTIKYVRTSGTLWWAHNRHKKRIFCMMCLLCATCVQIILWPIFE